MLEPVVYYKPREDRICGIYFNKSTDNYFKHWLSDSEILEFNKSNVKNIFDNDADIEQEEVVCYAVGDMTQQIVNKCYKLGYYA